MAVGLTSLALVAGTAMAPRPPRWIAPSGLQPQRSRPPRADGPVQAAPTGTAPVRVLVFHGAPDVQDDPVVEAAQAFAQLGAEHGFEVVASSDPAVFSPAALGEYRGVVFLSAEGTEFSAAQEAALKDYVNAGGGFLGVRDAARAHEASQWFTGLVGTRIAGAQPDPRTSPRSPRARTTRRTRTSATSSTATPAPSGWRSRPRRRSRCGSTNRSPWRATR
ncbi:ThuA domain-containing protein [Oerskovia sp. M15]